MAGLMDFLQNPATLNMAASLLNSGGNGDNTSQAVGRSLMAYQQGNDIAMQQQYKKMQMDKQLSDQERQRQEDEFYANTGKYYQQPEQQALNISGGLPTQEAANMIPNLQPVFDEKALYRDMLKVPSLAKEGVKGLFPSAVDNPAAVREWEYFSKLSPQEQQQFLVMKRAEQWKDLGNQVVMPTPGMPGSVSAAFQKGISPDAQPWVKGAQVQAQQGAQLAYEAPIKEAGTTGAKMGEHNMDQYETANTAVKQIADINRLITHINSSDAITGMGAEVLKNIERTKALMGSKVASGKVADTEILDVMMGSEVFPMIKALGVGAKGMDTPAEREFMRSVLTGSLPLNKDTLVKMAEIRKNVAERSVNKWNDRVKKGELNRFFDATGLAKEPLNYGETQKTNNQQTPPPGAVRRQKNNTTGAFRYFDAQGNQL